MAPAGLALVIVVTIALVIVILRLRAPRRALTSGARADDTAPLPSGEHWTRAAKEFADLSDAARCDFVFAVATLDADRSAPILEDALRDPSEAVALAAARALRNQSRTEVVQRYLSEHPGDRAQRIAQALDLLAPE